MSAETEAQANASDNVAVYAADDELLEWMFPRWEHLPCEMIKRCASIDGEVRRDANTTCIQLDQYRRDNLNPANGENHQVESLAVGDSSTTPTHGDTNLGNEIDRTPYTEVITDTQSLTIGAFLSQSEGNGPSGSNPSLQELGLYAGPYFLNHSSFTPIEKTDGKAISFEATLTFDTAQ